MNSTYNGDSKPIAILFLILIATTLLYTLCTGVLKAVDRITERDCARGITSACQYVK